MADQLRNEIRGNSYSNIKTTHINSMGVNITIKHPRSVYAGERYTIYASMRNRIDYARMGGLTLSFPQYNSIDANIISKRFDKLNGYLPPSKLYSRIYGRNIPIGKPNTNVKYQRIKISPGRESNPRSVDYKSTALPSELPGHPLKLKKKS